MPNTTIRVNDRTHSRLKEIAKREGKSMQEILDKLLDNECREQFFNDVNAAYANLRNNPEAWKTEQAERELFDNTLSDGIEKESWDDNGNVINE
jgi:hypothetical protein